MIRNITILLLLSLSFGIDHLLITQVVTQPDAAESFSIYNPTDSPIDLTNYYVCDDEDYYTMQTEGDMAPSHFINGFTARFPDINIDPNDTLTIVLHANYSDYYGDSFSPDLVMYVDQDNSMIETNEGSFGEPVTGNDDPIPKLDNDQELLILFYWDGDFSNLIQDVDYFLWGAYQTPINKTGISTYQDDTPIESQLFFETEAETYYAYSRIGTDEIDETQTGGNGITEHDETSENFRESWGIMPLFNLGCTNQDAPNYNPNAEIDDGSCLASFEDILNGEYEECFSSCSSTCPDILIQGIVVDYFDLTGGNGPFIIILENSAGIQLPLVVWLFEGEIDYPLFPFIVDNPLNTVLIQTQMHVGSYNGETQLNSCGIESIILVDIYGCPDPDACNYNPEATPNEEICAYTYDECGECGGDGIVDGACDCAGNVEDCEGVCGGSAIIDCAGICNGDAIVDECGECGGDGLSCAVIPFGTDSTLDIITWNIEQFPKQGESTIEYLVEIIQSSEIDIIALQEINSETDFNNLVNELDGWSGYRANSASGNIDLAYLYKSELTIISIEEIESLENYYFPRTPLQMEIEWEGDNIYIINNHFKCCGNGTIENEYDDDEYRRMMASQELQDYVDLYYPNEKVLILGDLNDEITEPQTQNVFWNFISNPNEYQFADMSIAEGSSDDWSYPGWPSHLDHIIISNELFNFVYDVSCIKYEESLENGWSEYDNYISDHRPVGIQLYWINGCTDPDATNYNPDATVDDGSCEYYDLGDVNCDGELNVLDIVSLVNIIMNDGEYIELGDVNGDGYLNILDVVILVNLILDGEPVCEDIDGNVYETIQIGDQLWMAANLKVTHYNDGSEIPTGYSNSEWGWLDMGAYAVYDNDPVNADVYGNLYNWFVVDDERGLCMEGWHVPSDEEWTDLITYLDVDTDPDVFGSQSYIAGGKIKEAGLEHWNYYSDEITEEATNESGFTGLPGGYRSLNNGGYLSMGNFGYFWSSSHSGYLSSSDRHSNAWYRGLNYNNSSVYRSIYDESGGFSIRCLGD